MQEEKELLPPRAKKMLKKLLIHGDERIDPYYWLRDRESEEVLEYLKAENAYTEAMLSHTKDLQEELYQEIVGRIKQTDMSVPYQKRGYYYITRYEAGQEYPIYSRKRGSLDAEEEILLNVNQLAKPHSYYHISGRSVSPDNSILAFGEDTVSRRIYTIKFKDLTTGQLLPDEIANTTGKAIWANDNQTVFYTVKDKNLRAYKIFKHRLGTDPAEDEEVYHETDATFSLYLYKTKSESYIVIGAYHTLTNEYRYLDADHPGGDFKVFQPRDKSGKLEYSIAHFHKKWLVLTNLDARNFRLMETPEHDTAKSHWREVIPHRPDILLSDLDVFKDYLVLSERIKGIHCLRILPWKGEDHYIDFGEETFVAYTSINPQYNTDILRISYTSLTTPISTYDYNMKTRELTLLKRQEVVGEFDPEHYQSERIYATAKDGAKVPISLVYRKGIKANGSNPLLLYGYGSYGASMEPAFSSVRLSLLDRGFIFAIAHIRGGQEMGRHWYDEGRMMKKKNTFTDFITCAEYLMDRKYTSAAKLFAMGGSAGGLLMGAVVNMRPDLWKGVIAAVPFVDVITTMLDETIPLTTGEFDEWGNPKDPEAYQYIKSYSPYDNVGPKDYPAMLITTGLHDSQVQYWEPAKWVAKLREIKTDSNPLLLYTNLDAGHGGASGRFKRFRETAMHYAFLIDLAGLHKPKN